MKNKGFTLIELIMVIMILGIISVYVIPKLFNLNDYYNTQKLDYIYQSLSSAQKLAISSRNEIHVKIDATTVRVCADSSCATVLNNPVMDKDLYNLNFTMGDSIFVSTSNFSFNPFGNPSFSSINTISVDTSNIYIEPTTGLIHK